MGIEGLENVLGQAGFLVTIRRQDIAFVDIEVVFVNEHGAGAVGVRRDGETFVFDMACRI